MKLTSVKIKNFRCYRNEIQINLSDLTAFIGKNDSGKSSILDALEIFFNNDVVKIDRDDLNKDALAAGESKVEISCIFENLPASIVIDADHPTSLSAEHLLNEEGNLEIKKQFSCTSDKPKEQVFIKANYPTVNTCSDLHQLKRPELKVRATGLNIDAANYNATVNSSIRAAIWNHVGELNLAEREIQVDKDEAKKVWDVLKTFMPVYALFQSDRKSREDDKEVTDPMKVAINEALKGVEAELLEIQQKVHEKAVEVAQRTLEKLQEMNPVLANELRPDFKKDPAWNSIFSLTLSSDKNIPINKRGSGVRRLILLNFFRAEAERRRSEVNNPSIIYAFEEPETSQHPDHQILLVKAFKELASSSNTQVLLTTHTPALGGLMENESLRLLTLNDAGEVVIERGNDEAYKKIANTLGVLPDPLASQIRLLVCVEGPNDVNFFRNVSTTICQLDPALPNLNTEPRVAIFPLGGGTLKEWVNNNYLSGLGIPEFHIYDRDNMANPSYQDAANAVIARGGNNHAVITNKKETENYIHYNAINRSLGIAIPAFGDGDDVPDIVAQAVYLTGGGVDPWATIDADKKSKKISNAKRRLNNHAVSQMTVPEFQQADPGNEIIGWFQLIADRII